MRRYYYNRDERFTTAIHPILMSCPAKCLPKSVLIMLCVSILVLVLYVMKHQSEGYILLINLNKPPTHVTNSKYLSVALDSSIIARNFDGFDMKSIKLEKMMKLIGGGYLRIGGKSADLMTFSRVGNMMYSQPIRWPQLDGGLCTNEDMDCDALNHEPFELSGKAWMDLNYLAEKTNYTIMFDLNALLRDANGNWDPDNAIDLIRFTSEHGFKVIWELGNEPNSYEHVFGYEVLPQQLAADYDELRQILYEHRNSMLVGPAITHPKLDAGDSVQYLVDFLSSLQPGVIDAITWHQYYFRGSTADMSSYLNPEIFDTLAAELRIIKQARNITNNEDIPIWLGETADAYGGGSMAYSNRFVSAFIWLDKLGLAAKHGVDVVVRQSLFSGYYSLLDHNYSPNPSWWINYFYKKIVGPEVIECLNMANSYIRLYCHCARKNNEYVNKPAIVVFGMNIHYVTAQIRIAQAHFEDEEGYSGVEPEFKIHEFLLRSQFSMAFKEIYLQYELLFIQQQDGLLKKYKPIVYTSKVIIIPPYTMGFWIIEHPKARNVCKS